MIDFLQVLLSGIGVGSTYAMMGLSLVIIYKTSDIMNFTQGEMALITAYFTYMLLTVYQFHFFMAFVCAFVFTILVGFVVEFTIIRRAKNPSHIGMIIITMGVEMIILGFVSWKFGADTVALPFPIGPYDAINWGGLFVSMMEVLTFVVAIIIIIALFLFFRYSKLGLAMKATQQSQTAARLMGIRYNRIHMFTWGLSSLVGSTAGLLIAPLIMQPYMMWDPMLKGFAAAVLGGMNSMPGVVFGAYTVGIIENLFGTYISIEFKSIVAFLIIVLVLCIKPSGLFSRHYVKKV